MTKKITIVFLFFFSVFTGSIAQTKEKDAAKRIVKTERNYTNKKLLYFAENDRKANRIFIKNYEMDGITIIAANEYDSLNRETLSYVVHSNFGYSLSEKVYEGDFIKEYDYHTQDTIHPFDQKTLSKIKTKEFFLQLAVNKALRNGTKQLTGIKVLDSVKNVIKEYSISKTGDTTAIYRYKYNNQNKMVFFSMYTFNSPEWSWDIYDLYNDHSDVIKSYRLQTEKGIRDTTEVYNYVYNAKNKLIFQDYYWKHQFMNKTKYIYDKKSRLVAEYFYEKKSKPAVKTNYIVDKDGKILKKIQMDYRKPKDERRKVFVFKTKYTYW